jgi:tetratricopeptide (TPR) repeat protein
MSKLEYKPDPYFLGLLVNAGFTRGQANKIFNELFYHIYESLLVSKAVQIKGFGSFRLYSKINDSLSSDNPKEKIIRFYPSSAFKLLVDNITQETKVSLLTKLRKPNVDSKNHYKKVIASKVSQVDEEFPTLPDEELEATTITVGDVLNNKEFSLEQKRTDFDLHYNIGIAYKEMGLYTLAIEDLEKAINLLENHLASRKDKDKYIQACEVLSLCSSALGKFDESEKWLLKGLKLTKPTESQYKALRYDLALLYEATDRMEEATEAFFDVYAIDINFRRVAQKLKILQSRYIKKARDERKNQLIPVLVRGKTISGERFEEETLIVNVSRRGAGIRISYEPHKDSFLELRFSDVQRVKLAKIVWCSPLTNPSGGFQAGIIIYHEAPSRKKKI